MKNNKLENEYFKSNYYSEKSRHLSRSLYVAEDIIAGEVITEQNVRSVRPGYGIHPKYLQNILAKKAMVNLKLGTALDWSMVK